MLIVNIKANAQINNEQRIIEQQDWITRQQQNKIEEDKRLKEGELKQSLIVKTSPLL